MTPHALGLEKLSLDHVRAVAAIARDVAAPRAADVDIAARFPGESLTALAEQGFLGLCVDRDFGGLGDSMHAYAGAVEELAKSCASTAMIYVMHVTAAQAIASSKSLTTREHILRDIAAGKHLTTLALSERGSRSQFWAPVSMLVADARGELSVTAQKSWVTAAPHADSYVANALAPHAKGHPESTMFLVRSKAPGIHVENAFNGLGLRGNESSPVTFTDVHVDAADLVSAQGEGAGTMLQVVLPWFAVGTASMAHGLCLSALSETIAHLSTTTLAPAGIQLRDLPNLRARVARMSLRTEQSRSLLRRALDEIASGSETAPVTVLQARLSAIEAALEVTDLAMKACGGAAFSKHLGLERSFRDARAGWVMAPTADHLEDFIGRALLGLPLFS